MPLPTLLTTALGVTTAAAVGAAATDPRSDWYSGLDKPSWQPPPPAYGIVWTPLYAALAVAAARTYDRLPAGRGRRAFVAALVANLGLNAGWSWLFFRAHSPRLALAEIVLLEASVLDLARRANRVDRVSHGLLVPYAGWVGFASALNAELARRNPVSPRAPRRTPCAPR